MGICHTVTAAVKQINAYNFMNKEAQGLSNVMFKTGSITVVLPVVLSTQRTFNLSFRLVTA